MASLLAPYDSLVRDRELSNFDIPMILALFRAMFPLLRFSVNNSFWASFIESFTSSKVTSSLV